MRSKLTRRTLLASGLAAAALAPLKAGRADGLAGACILAPEQALGPYHLADELLRRDIREDKPGIPLALYLQVLNVRTCQPLADAAVDVWHCDAAGAYSGFGAGEESHSFLRGIQITGRDGITQFNTIFPGCYPGRTNHIHFQVRTAGAVAGETYRGGHVAHTGQVFFPEEITLQLMKTRFYAAQPGSRTGQAEDGIFQRQGGRASTAMLAPLDQESWVAFVAKLIVAVDPSQA
ncbi:intradiol ring-cleavage dioxygenase [Dongia sp. agr-C8]